MTVPGTNLAAAVRGGVAVGGARSAALPLAAVSGLLVGVLAGVIVIATGGDSSAAQPGASAAADAAVVASAGGDSEASADVEPAPEPSADVEPSTDVEPEPEEPVEPEVAPPRTARVRFDVLPADIAGDVRIEVDGQRVEGDQLELELGDEARKLEIVARATGYKRFSRTVAITGDDTITLRLERRRSSADKGSGKKRDKRRGSGGKKRDRDDSGGPGGLIDL